MPPSPSPLSRLKACGGWLDRTQSYRLRRSEEPIHLFELRLDDGSVRQLTFGVHDNVDPCYLPDGQICFCSNRTGILNEYEMQRAELLHVMEADGSNVRQISFFLSGDYNPMVLR